MSSKPKKPKPTEPREVWLLVNPSFTGHVNYESESEAKYAARTLYNDPNLKPVRYVPMEDLDGR